MLDALVMAGINHFRAWTQPATGARFISVSTEKPCGTAAHCVISFDQGRIQLMEYMNKVATFAGWPAPTVSEVRVLPAGGIGQQNGESAPYDGTVWVVTLN